MALRESGLGLENFRVTRRLEWRRSCATSRHRNHAREKRSGQAPWDAEDLHDATEGFNDRLDDYVKYLELGDEEEE